MSVSSDEHWLDDFVSREPQTDARVAFFAGRESGCFRPESQQRSYEHFERFRPGVHALHVIPGYSHLDLLIGKNAARDVFPLILDELAT